VFGADDLPLFRVRSSGSTVIERSQAGTTYLEINNASSSTGASSALRLAEGPTLKGYLQSIASGSSSLPNTLQLINTTPNGMLSFGTANNERMRIYPNGYVAINGVNPAGYGARLLVQHGVDNSTGVIATHNVTFEPGSAPQVDSVLYVQARETVQSGASNTGSLSGILSTARLTGPGTLKQLDGGYFEAGVSDPAGVLTEAYGLRVGFVRVTGSTIATGTGLYLHDVLATNDWGIYQAGADDDNFFAGNVGIGTNVPADKLHVVGNAKVTGDLSVDGNIAAKFQDLAEWVPSTENLMPGTVVSLDPDHSNHVMASSRAYDTAVAGVVSAQPGIILGEQGTSKEQIATTGRVRVRVDATSSPIRIGDLLVSSDKRGMAMRSQPIDVGGIALHRPGTVIGKALEPLDGGVADILVLLSLQ
jgi:hypothetical protein